MLEGLRNTADDIVFLLRHDTTKGIVRQAQEIIRRNQILLDGMLDYGLVTSDRLEEIRCDDELQGRFSSIMKSARDGGDAALEARFEIALLPPDEFAGWLEYYKTFHEKHWHIHFPTDEV
ncbi:MAG: hypothetical protein A2900_03535 [Candidatus Chisholmbacteria bacterium RIFCSPLOWO2_01_FULL_50_28]|uniref:Uncharacterized protein n=1 Tax=Candidatus Chisholmbacteria bacterium RIFCSPHIGHO2_01_FULL_52_32 TaxID=1797591 RepID=A0A1G1VSU7_9BACT|nr:MAG: hypothetical protein A2786_03210 [Candidatus Chisholmbacteria bacterium RIFCSPHIGHO2_01_FULL_52_32]OGY20148.1 MAG: hypothetical protein A2900_03535 [Candidatus Chisholmbacteria bacterium RIFCSPLOWO2_01_FULL_50_28]